MHGRHVPWRCAGCSPPGSVSPFRIALVEGAPTTQDELEVLRRRLHANEDMLLALAEEHERGEISDLHFARLANAYQAEHEQLAEQVRQAEATTAE
jgi:hypothetical protein